MARRRRKKNPLLTRILAVSILAHVIALPILAHFGAFDKLKKEFGTSRVVMVTVPPEREVTKKPVEKTEKKAHKTQGSAKKAPSTSAKTTAAAKSNLPQPKVVASAGDGGNGDGGPSVDPNGTGKAGVLPTQANGGNGGAGANTSGGDVGTNPQPPVNPPATEPKAEPKPPTPPVEPKTEPPKTEPTPKPKRIVQPEPLTELLPEIPDELRTEPFEKTLIVDADVDTSGKPQEIKVAQSTGMKQLDDIGLDTARRYRFHPATVDDVPVQGHVRFRIIFKVE